MFPRPHLRASLGAPFSMAAPHGAREARAPERGRTERCDALVSFLGGAPPPEGEALPQERRNEARRIRILLVRSSALVLRCRVCWRFFVEKPCQPNVHGVMHMTPFLVALPCASSTNHIQFA